MKRKNDGSTSALSCTTRRGRRRKGMKFLVIVPEINLPRNLFVDGKHPHPPTLSLDYARYREHTGLDGNRNKWNRTGSRTFPTLFFFISTKSANGWLGHIEPTPTYPQCPIQIEIQWGHFFYIRECLGKTFGHDSDAMTRNKSRKTQKLPMMEVCGSRTMGVDVRGQVLIIE